MCMTFQARAEKKMIISRQMFHSFTVCHLLLYTIKDFIMLNFTMITTLQLLVDWLWSSTPVIGNFKCRSTARYKINNMVKYGKYM
jgi:hypothetical protein